MPTLRDEWSFGPTGAVRLLGAMIVVTLTRCAGVFRGDVKTEVEVETRVGLARVRSVLGGGFSLEWCRAVHLL
jgi:hypothetical protein